MKYNKTNRRMFLQGAGNFMLAMPFLPSLLPRESWAQAMTPNKRFLTISGSLDLGHNANWIPSLTPNASTPRPPLYGRSLNSYLSSLNIMRGLDIGGYYGHGMAPKLGSYKR